MVVWAPSSAGTGRHPVVIFSYGFGGCARQSTFLMKALAAHLAWTDVRGPTHDAITTYAIAFLDRYVPGAIAPPLLTHAGSAVAELRYDSELGRATLPPWAEPIPSTRQVRLEAVTRAWRSIVEPGHPRRDSRRADLPYRQLRRTHGRAVDVQQERISPGHRELEQIELERQVHRDRIHAF